MLSAFGFEGSLHFEMSRPDWRQTVRVHSLCFCAAFKCSSGFYLHPLDHGSFLHIKGQCNQTDLQLLYIYISLGEQHVSFLLSMAIKENQPKRKNNTYFCQNKRSDLQCPHSRCGKGCFLPFAKRH